MKKIFIFVLAFVMLFAAVACGGKSSGSAGTTCDVTTTDAPGGTEGPGSTTEPPQTTEGLLGFLPDDLYYDGTTLTVLQQQAYGTAHGNEVSVTFDEVVPGDKVSESVYERNAQVYDRLGVTIEDVMGSAWDTWHSDVYTSVFSEDGAYDLVCGTPSSALRCAVQGTIINLGDLDSINLDAEWWDQQQRENMTFGGEYVYTLSGDINYYDNYASSCIFFNTTLFNTYNIEVNPYELVRNDEWTFDAMLEICTEFYNDEDGSTDKTFADRYGFVSNNAAVGRFLRGFKMPQVTVDDMNWPTINESQAIVDAIDRIVDGLLKAQGTWTDLGGGSYSQIFYRGRALFMEDNLAALVNARTKMDDDLGCLPYPKYNETQETFCCPVSDPYASVYGIVRTADWEMCGYVLDTMGAVSMDTVTESVIRTNVMVQAVRDEDCEEMIRIIFDSAYYPLETVGAWGTFDDIPSVIGWELVNNYTTLIAEQKESVMAMIEADMAALRNPEY